MPPARPPPPNLIKEKPAKNFSALHQNPVINSATLSNPTEPHGSMSQGSPKAHSKQESPSKSTSALHQSFSPRSAVMGIGTSMAASLSSLASSVSPLKKSPLSCKKLGFSVSSRPLPETPHSPVEEGGEIYCEIDGEAYYEESDALDTNPVSSDMSSQSISQHMLPNNSPCQQAPPPLPSRGPPPMPILGNYPAKPQGTVQNNTESFEDYDIPEELDEASTSKKQIISSNSPITNKKILSITPAQPRGIASFPLILKSRPILNPPLPEKKCSDNSTDLEDENIYKVPTSTLVNEDIYKVPSSFPVPVAMSKELSSVANTNEQHAYNSSESTFNSSQHYLSPSSDNGSLVKAKLSEKGHALATNGDHVSDQQSTVAASSVANTELPSGDGDRRLLNCSLTNKIISKASLNAESSLGQDSNRYLQNSVKDTASSSLSATLAKINQNVSVKERIALLNSANSDCKNDHSTSKYAEDLVVKLGNQEIRLDHNKKKAFLESTLNFDSSKQNSDSQVNLLKNSK